MVCNQNFIRVVFERHELVSFDIDNMYLADGSCKASYNETHVFVQTALNSCGMKYSETEQEMFYSNTLRAVAPVSPGAVITRKQTFVFSFRCAYSRLITISGFRFAPPKPQVVFEQSKLRLLKHYNYLAGRDAGSNLNWL